MAGRTLRRVISGGQTGVDQAALRAARRCGLATGGWCPPGRLCEDGRIPGDLTLQETPLERSPKALDTPRSLRSEWNVRDSDATLVLRPEADARRDPGSDWTVVCAAELYRRPLLVYDPFDPQGITRIEAWLSDHAIACLHVAGPSEATVPGIGAASYRLLLAVFARRA